MTAPRAQVRVPLAAALGAALLGLLALGGFLQRQRPAPGPLPGVAGAPSEAVPVPQAGPGTRSPRPGVADRTPLVGVAEGAVEGWHVPGAVLDGAPGPEGGPRCLTVRVITTDGEPTERALDPQADPNRFVPLVAAAFEGPAPEWAPELQPLRETRLGVGRFRPGTCCPPGVEPRGFIGALEVEVERPVQVGLYLRHLLVAQRAVAADEREVVFVVDPAWCGDRAAELRGECVDAATGAPVAVRVGLGPSLIHGLLRPGDERGRFAFEGQLPGRYELRVQAPGYQPLVHEVDLPPGRTTDVGRLRLERAVDLAGQFRDEHGAPQSTHYEWARAVPERGGELEVLGRSRIPAGPDGGFHLRGLAPGELWVRALDWDWVPDDAPHCSRWTRADLSDGDLLDLVVRVVPPASLTLRNVALPVVELEYRVEEPGGLVAIAGSLGAEPVALSLAPGRLTVVVTAGGRERERVELLLDESARELTLGG